MYLDDLLVEVIDKDGSDLHITVGVPPIIRIDGKLEKTDYPILTSLDTQQLIYDTLTEAQRKIFEEEHELDFSYSLPGMGRFRGNIFLQHQGMAAVFRIIPENILSFEQLGLPADLKQLLYLKKGLVLVTGATGSGKSTTLAAMIDLINEERYDHIITIENPIEFVHKHKKCIVNQREVGAHTKSFARALRSALREDPDIILIGEMRDFETISEAITAAETGHLVFGTLHSSSAIKTIDRLIDVFPPHQQEQIRTQLSESIEAIISQQLIPRKDGFGRALALEIMIATSGVRNLIRENKTYQIESIMQTSKDLGMQTIDQCLKELVERGDISGEEAYNRAESKKVFEKYMGYSSTSSYY